MRPLISIPILFCLCISTESVCEDETCTGCLRKGSECGWCSHELCRRPGGRCGPVWRLLAEGCASQHIRTAGACVHTEDSSDPWGPLSPHRAAVWLRPGGTASVQLLVRRNLGPPPALDVYYLMDASASMLPHFRAAKDLGSLLARVLGDAAPRTAPPGGGAGIRRADHVLHLGFGAFVDKPVSPFASSLPERRLNPCWVVGLACLPPFSFWHALPLGSVAVADAETVPPVPEFTLRVQGQRISANLDAPEGGLDAILQAAVCKEQLGWRPGALHVLLVASDADLHLPLDARLAGVVRPHDGRCHLSGRSIYTRAADMEYPSLGMLGDALNENNIKLIFAVSRTQYELYQNYSKLILGSTAVVLETRSHTVPNLILNMYREFTSQLELIGNLQDLSIAVSETCQDKAKAWLEQCQEDDDEDTIRFNISLEAMGCPSMQPHRTLVVKPRGFLHSLLLSVHITCSDDPCDQMPRPRDSANIGGALTAQVGAKLITQELERGNCSPTTKDGSEKPGSNQEQLSRAAVDDQRADVNCPASSGLLCSGRGVCHIGRCQCRKGWIGDACQRAWSPARGRSSSSSDAIPLCPSRTDGCRDCVECGQEKREVLCARSVKINFLDHLSGCAWSMPWLRTFTAVCAGVVALGLLPFCIWKTVVTIVDCRRTPWTRQPVPPRGSTETSSTFRNRTFLRSEMQMTPGI